MTRYLDTSEVTKLYVEEIGSSALIDLLGDEKLATSAITSIEFVSAIARRHREGDLTADRQLLSAARKEGLDVWDPADPPTR